MFKVLGTISISDRDFIFSFAYLFIPREVRSGAPRREVYNLVAREARVYHTSIARPA